MRRKLADIPMQFQKMRLRRSKTHLLLQNDFCQRNKTRLPRPVRRWPILFMDGAKKLVPPQKRLDVFGIHYTSFVHSMRIWLKNVNFALKCQTGLTKIPPSRVEQSTWYRLTTPIYPRSQPSPRTNASGSITPMTSANQKISRRVMRKHSHSKTR